MKKNKTLILFCIVSLIGILSFFVYAFYKEDAFSWLVMEHNPYSELTDYFRHIAFAANLNTLYNSVEACFPPLAYILYRFLFIINPFNPGDITINWDYLAGFMYAPYNNWICIGGIVLLVICFYGIIQRYLENNKLTCLFTICLAFSLPFFAGVIERDNLSFLVLILILAALYFKDSENKFLRELSLILFSVASSFKLYPLAFSLLYLFEKRYKEFFRYGIYSAIGIIFPFFILGDFNVLFPKFLNNLTYVNNSEMYNILSLPALIRLINRDYLGINTTFIPKIILIIQILYLLFVIIRSYKTKHSWIKMLYLSSLMIILLNKSYRYTLIYSVIPLLFFLREHQTFHFKDFYTITVTILFAFIFSIPILYFVKEPEMISYISLYALIIFVTVMDIIEQRKGKKQKSLLEIKNA